MAPGSGRKCGLIFCLESLEHRLVLSVTQFAVIGDFGNASPAEADVANLVKGWNPDFVATVGDNDYSNDGTPDYPTNVGQFYGEFITNDLSTNRFFPALGNHDWDGPAGAQPYLDYFTLPGNERYYSVVRGPVELFILDSDSREPDGITSTSVQAAWLQQALAASTTTWQVVLLHHAPFSSSGRHGSTEVVQWPYQQWGADIVLAGHDHDYERLLINDFPYIVNGVGGASLRDFGTPLEGSLVRYSSDYGAMRVNADPGQITFEFITRTGQLIDTYTLEVPGPVTVAPTDGTTQVTEGGATDDYTLVLQQPPTADVTISLTPDAQLAVSTSTVTFTPDNWDVPQTVTVSAVDDDAIEGEHTGRIVHTASSIDPAFDGIGVASLTARVIDNEPSPILVATGAVWKYLDDGSDQGIAWRASDFDDSAWLSGPAQLGFGDGDENTALVAGYTTYYFRHTFDAPDPAIFSTINLRLLRDDGAVIYLNGNEILRSNMRDGIVTSSTNAASVVSGNNESRFFTTALDPALFIHGTNVLAVEVHQANSGSSDISFDMDLIGTPRAVPNRPPELAPIGDTSIDENSTLTFDASATDADLPDETLTWSLEPGDGPVPAGASIDPATGRFAWTPDETQDGVHGFRIRVTDRAGEFDEKPVSVSVGEVNQPPSLAPIGPRTVQKNDPLTFTISASDPDRVGGSPQLLFFSADNLPDGASFDETTQAFSWTPSVAGTFDVTFRVTDGSGESVETVTITVTEAYTPPVTASFQDGVGGYNGARDTEIRQGDPTSNYGSAKSLKVDGRPLQSALMKWDVSSIPAGSVVQAVTLTLHIGNSSSATFEVYELKKNWTETHATWNAFAGGGAWEIPGAQGASDRGTALLGNISARTTGLQTFTLDAAAVQLVQRWVSDPTSNFGFIIQDFDDSNGLGFFSSETGRLSGRPKLEITYAAPAGGAPAAANNEPDEPSKPNEPKGKPQPDQPLTYFPGGPLLVSPSLFDAETDSADQESASAMDELAKLNEGAS